MAAHSAPKLSRKYQRKVDALEAELDVIYPQWRDPRSRQKTEAMLSRPLAHRARIRWCLKRHMLLTHRTSIASGAEDEQQINRYLASMAPPADGFPDPRDWPVLVTYSGLDGQGAGKCFAHPIMPDHGDGKPPAEAITGPPKIDAVDLPVNLCAIAAELGVPIEVVEDQIPHVPDGEDPAAWIRASLATGASKPKK